MFRRRRLRQIPRRLTQPSFQGFDPLFQLSILLNQQANNRLSFRRLSSNQIFRDFQRHPRVVANTRNQRQVNSTGISIQPVNGYARRNPIPAVTVKTLYIWGGAFPSEVQRS